MTDRTPQPSTFLRTFKQTFKRAFPLTVGLTVSLTLLVSATQTPTLQDLINPLSKNHDLQKAIRTFNQNLSDPEVLYQAAVCYLSCNGLPANDRQAFLMLKKAAPQNPDAQALLAYLQHTGKGTTPNLALAQQNLQGSAIGKSRFAPAIQHLFDNTPAPLTAPQAQNSANAQYLLGVYYAKRIQRSNTTNLRSARQAFQNARKLGLPHAQLALAALAYQNREDQTAFKLLAPYQDTPEGQSMKFLYQGLALRVQAERLPYLKKLQALWESAPSINTFRNLASFKLRMSDPKNQKDALNMLGALNFLQVFRCDDLARQHFAFTTPQASEVARYVKVLQQKTKTDPLAVQVLNPQVCPFGWSRGS